MATWTTHIDVDVNCVFNKSFGPFEIEQIKNAADEMFSHPDYRVGMNILRDLKDQIIPPEITFKALSSAAKKMMADNDNKFGNCKMAIVAGDVQTYSKVHQYIKTGRFGDTPIERKAFRDIEKALRWLDIPEG